LVFEKQLESRLLGMISADHDS